jgi:hypothetical protein
VPCAMCHRLSQEGLIKVRESEIPRSSMAFEMPNFNYAQNRLS